MARTKQMHRGSQSTSTTTTSTATVATTTTTTTTVTPFTSMGATMRDRGTTISEAVTYK